MGGIPTTYDFWERLVECPNVFFVVPGGSETFMRHGNVLRLPQHCEFYHPDLVNACDAVVGKAGYSTIAEAYHAGLPFGYVPRARLCETSILTGFIQGHMQGIEIGESEFLAGAWVDRLTELLALPRRPRPGINGAVEAADFICRLLQL
jgi:hypothetical protein